MSILYILDTFPKLTETFIEREITELISRGLNIQILSLNKSSDSVIHPESQKLQKHTSYLPKLSSPRTWFLFLLFLISHPLSLGNILLKCCPFSPCPLRFFYHRLKGVITATAFYQKHPSLSPQHIHAHFAYVASDVAEPLSMLYKTNWSLSCHAWDIFTQPSALLTHRTKQAENIFTCSKISYSDTIRKAKDIKNKLILMPHGLAISKLKPTKTPSSNQLIAIGRLEEKKGFSDLIEACHLLVKQGKTITCEIIGSGQLQDLLQNKINSKNLSKVIQLTPALSQPEIIEKLNSATLFILPCKASENRDQDGIPNALLEAMALAKPVISTDIGGIPEVLTNNQTGLLCPPGNPEKLANAISELLDNPEKAAKLGQNAREYIAKHYDISKNIEPLYTYLEGKCQKTQ